MLYGENVEFPYEKKAITSLKNLTKTENTFIQIFVFTRSLNLSLDIF